MTKEINFKNFTNKAKACWNYFSTYERWWFFIFAIIAIVASIVMPEESANGIDGTLITIFVVVSTIICLLCELLASKQSKWNAFLYIFVEVLEILRYLLIAMLANALVCLLFWLPAHILTFINWGKKEDREDKKVTVVRTLKTKHTVILVSVILIWTMVIGYLLVTFLPDVYMPESVVFNSEAARIAAAYLDAGSSALSITCGVLLLFRFRECWNVWMVFSILLIAYMILVGWWAFIVLQLGYVTNTIYGYIKWTKYIKAQNENAEGATSGGNAQQTSNEDSNQNQLEEISDGELKNE